MWSYIIFFHFFFKVSPKQSAVVPKVKKAAMCLREKINVLGQFYSGSNYSLRAIGASAVHIIKLSVKRNAH